MRAYLKESIIIYYNGPGSGGGGMQASHVNLPIGPFALMVINNPSGEV